mmetsp:Transcript_14901/g.41042  ORF Transcript_14901/g.41042 Transcript_14901/m.41042 type:complete len:105 (+) Transcript_14901:1338-1652(+)
MGLRSRSVSDHFVVIIVRVVFRVLERADRFSARWAGVVGLVVLRSGRRRAAIGPTSTQRVKKHCFSPWMGLLRLPFSSDKSWKALDVCTFVQSVKGDMRWNWHQ